MVQQSETINKRNIEKLKKIKINNMFKSDDETKRNEDILHIIIKHINVG